jgi:hypothetical protein
MGFKTLLLAVMLAQLSGSDSTAIERYRRALQSAESGPQSSALENTFNAIGPLRDALIGKLESLSADEYKRLEQQLRGVLLNREEVVFIKPDIQYFAGLAAQYGDEADQLFFAGMKATYPHSVWPIYIEQQTDYSGCTRFGSGTLLEVYRAWAEFQRRFPNRYAAAAKEQADAVLNELTQSTCACGDAARAEQDFEQFLRGFPSSSARARIEQRLEALRGSRSNIRSKCVSG